MAADKSSLFSLCGEIDSDANFSECRDKKSWITLPDAAKISMKESFQCQLGKMYVQIFLCVITVHADRHLLIKRICYNYQEKMRKRIPV